MPALDVEEDFFINYGFVTADVQALMHPRSGHWPWTAARGKQVRAVLEFVRSRGSVHPREVDEHFSHGTVTNYWGGSSSATTHLLDDMHYRGLLRVVRRERWHPGLRCARAWARPARSDRARTRISMPSSMSSFAIRAAAGAQPVEPGEAASLRRSTVVRRVGGRPSARPAAAGACASGWHRLVLAGRRSTRVIAAPADVVRLLAPFDPVVWDRRRFEMLWGWAYRFEAYTPVVRRKLGYYALPLLWRDRVIGWANVSVSGGALEADVGYIASRPRGGQFRRALDEELNRLRAFLGLGVSAPEGLPQPLIRRRD